MALDSSNTDGPKKGERKNPRQRFTEVAARRTRTIIRMLRLLGNCSNPSSYLYKPEEVQRMFDAIQQELSDARSKFERRGKRAVEFHFDE